MAALLLCGCTPVEPSSLTESTGITSAVSDPLILKERVENEYAEQFSIERYEGGYSMITIMNGERFFIVPEGKNVPDSPELNGVSVIRQPAKNFYIATTPVMGLLAELNALEAVRFSSARAEEWYVEAVRAAMERGEIIYTGKYQEPDYESLLSGGCTLSIQSAMIEQSPDIREKLEELGITVFVDYASREPHPLGRSEWIKVYAEMCGKPAEAERLFSEQSEKLKFLESIQPSGKTAAFFYINTSGQAVTRRSGDYITKMIELAGGSSVFGDNSNSVMEAEKFYTTARDADFIIYNSAMIGEVKSVKELVSKYPLLADFKAVKENNVWCTRDNMYQETLGLGTMTCDFYAVFSETYSENPPTFLYKLEGGS